MKLIKTDTVREGPLSFLTEREKSSRKLRMLGINKKNLSGIQTLGELQSLAKKQYRKISRYLHPDAPKKGVPPQRPSGQTFQSATESYHWVMQLTEREIERAKKQRSRYIYEDGKFKGSVSILEGVYDCPLPWHFNKSTDYGYGYQESLEHLNW